MPQSVPFQGVALPSLILTKNAKGLLAPPLQAILRLSGLSCPRSKKTAMANKRESVQSPLRSPFRSPEYLSSSESSTSSSGDDNKMLLGEDTDNKIETPFVFPAKCSNPLPQGTQSEVHGGRRYDSPLACGRVSLKSANRPVTGLACALHCCEFNESLVSSKGSWMDYVSDAEGDVNENTFSNKDGDEGQTTHTPVCPTTLFNNNRNHISHLMGRGKVSILNGIWPGCYNITLLTHFVACHLAGDWNSYLPFAHWVDTQSLEYPSSSIQLDNWRSLKSDGGDLSALPSLGDAKHAVGGRPAVGPKEMDGKLLGHNLCNKTDVDSIESLPLVGPGTVATGASRCAPPRRVTLAKSLSGHSNIRIMFPTMRAHMPAKVAAAQIMEANIVLQETEEATRVEHLQAIAA